MADFGNHRVQKFTPAKDLQTITFDALAAKTYGDAPFTVSATASSGLAVSFSSATPEVCTVAETTMPSTAQVTVLAEGTCTITASQAGDDDYAAATPISQSFAVAGGGQVITFTEGTPTVAERGSTLAIVVTSNTTTPIVLSSAPADVCTVSGTDVSFVEVGTCTVTATQVATVNYNAASASHEITVVRTLTDTALSNVSGSGFYGGTASLTATLSKTGGEKLTGETVTFTLEDEPAGEALTDANGVATVSGIDLTGRNAGSYELTASFVGNDTSALAASEADGTLTVTQAAQTVSFTTAVPNPAYVGGSYSPSATATSGLGVSVDSSTPSVCSYSSGTISFITTGPCTVTANQGGDANYAAAPEATQSITVSATPDTTAPTISLTTPANGAVYAQGATVVASYSCADSGSGVATCSGPVGSGASISTATPGNYSFTVNATDNAGNPASVTHSYTVQAPAPVIDRYTIDFDRSALNQFLYSVRVGQGISGPSNTDRVFVAGLRLVNGSYRLGQAAKVVSLYGGRRVTVAKSGSNTPNATGGRLLFDFGTDFGDGLVIVKTLTLHNVTSSGAQVSLYRGSKLIKTVKVPRTAAGRSVTVTLDTANVSLVSVLAQFLKVVDDIVFEDERR